MIERSRVDADIASCANDVHDTADQLQNAQGAYKTAQDEYAVKGIDEAMMKKAEDIFTFEVSYAHQRVAGIQEYLLDLHNRKKDENRIGVNTMNKLYELYFLMVGPAPADLDRYEQGKEAIRVIVEELRNVDDRHLESSVFAEMLVDARTF